MTDERADPKSEAATQNDSTELTHVDSKGHVRMVNIGEKVISHRVSVARAEVHMAAATLAKIADGQIPKGDVLATARLAGIQAAKRMIGRASVLGRLYITLCPRSVT